MIPAEASSWLAFDASRPSRRSNHDMDITPVFNQVLAAHDSRPVEPYTFRLQDLDEFLKEAYRIVGHVAGRGSQLDS